MSFPRFIGLWGPVAAFMLAVFTLAGEFDGPVFEASWDKLAHFGSYFVFGFLCLRATHGGVRPLRSLPTVLALLLTLSFGAVDELHQAQIPGRDPSVFDWIADATGGGLSIVFLALVSRWRGDRGR